MSEGLVRAIKGYAQWLGLSPFIFCEIVHAFSKTYTNIYFKEVFASLNRVASGEIRWRGRKCKIPSSELGEKITS